MEGVKGNLTKGSYVEDEGDGEHETKKGLEIYISEGNEELGVKRL